MSIEDHLGPSADQREPGAHELASIACPPASLRPRSRRHASPAAPPPAGTAGRLARTRRYELASAYCSFGDHLPDWGRCTTHTGFRDIAGGCLASAYVLVDSAAPPPRRQDWAPTSSPRLAAGARRHPRPTSPRPSWFWRATPSAQTTSLRCKSSPRSAACLQQDFYACSSATPPTAGYRCDAVASGRPGGTTARR